jgi:hypothetical protein
MELFEKKYSFFTVSNTALFSSLQRYFRYILNQKLNSYSETAFLTSSVLLVHQEEKQNLDVLELVANNNDIKIIILGYDNSSTINLIDFGYLKENFSKVISKGEIYYKKLFSEEELKEKLKNFFHSHGEDSLFEYLNWTYYFLKNGPVQFLSNQTTYEEYINAFLKPGLKKWDYFKSRFLRYKFFIRMSNFEAILKKLETAINEADNYITLLSKLSEEKILRENINFFSQNIEKVTIIDEILNDFYRGHFLGATQIQNTSG